MMKSTARILNSLFFFLFILSAYCQTEQFKFKHFGIDEGALVESYYGIVQDPKGYIWLASEAGMYSYNGRQFQLKAGISKTFPIPGTFDITLDNHGRVWGSCADGRVYYFENDSQYFPKSADSLSCLLEHGKRLINQIGFDQRNCLWIGNANSMATANEQSEYSQLNLMRQFSDTVNTVIKVIGKGKTILSKNRLELPCNLPRGLGVRTIPDGYSIACQAVFFDGTQTTFTINRSNNQRYIPTGESTELSDGSILFSIANTLYHVAKNGTVKSYEFYTVITHLSTDRLNNIWIGTQNALYRYMNSDLNGRRYSYLFNEYISGVLLDTEYGLWVTTITSGLYYTPNIFNSYIQEEENIPNGICGNIFLFDNALYGITAKSGLLKIESDTQRFLNPNQDGSEIFGTIRNGDKIYAWGRGLQKVDRDLRTIKKISPSKFVGAIYDVDSSLLFMTGDAIYRMQSDSLFEICKVPGGRSAGLVRTPDKRIWVGTLMGLYNLENGKLKDAGIINNGRDTIKIVKRLFVDVYGDLYALDLGRSLHILHHNEWHYIDTNLLPKINFAHRIYADSSGIILATCGSGIISFRYNFDSRKVSEYKWYSTNTGLAGNIISYSLINNGCIYVATKNGISIIRISPLNYSLNGPPVWIHHVEINDKNITADSFPVLSYNQNNFRFFIDVLDYQARGKPVYKYKLSGFDEKFLSGNEASIYYANLPSGDYELIVIGVSNNGFESNPVTFKFRIRPPFWLTWWFISLEILFGAFIISLYIRFRISKIRKAEEEKAEINIQLAAYQMTALRAQMNPHFIFNAINSIQRFVLGNDQQTAYSYLAKFSRLIRQVLNNSKEELITVKEELDTLNLYVEMENLRFEKNFDFETEIDPAVSLTETQIPCMLIQPFVENAIWHGIMPLGDLRKGKIKLQFLRKGLSLLIMIEDNGVGRNQNSSASKTHKSMGISIARNRLRLYDMRSQESFSFISYTDLKDEAGNDCGTIAQIELANFFNEKKS